MHEYKDFYQVYLSAIFYLSLSWKTKILQTLSHSHHSTLYQDLLHPSRLLSLPSFIPFPFILPSLLLSIPIFYSRFYPKSFPHFHPLLPLILAHTGSYYGNRAATWIMLKEFQRAVDDCVTGLKLEKTIGELDKLRQRYASHALPFVIYLIRTITHEFICTINY